MPATLDPITRGHLARDIEILGEEFAGIFSVETIERYLAESLEQLAEARVTSFVPLFVNRFAPRTPPRARPGRRSHHQSRPRNPLRVRAQRRALTDGRRPA